MKRIYGMIAGIGLAMSAAAQQDVPAGQARERLDKLKADY